VTATDYSVFCDVSGGNRTITLPAAASNLGRIYVVRRVGTGGATCTLTPVATGGTLDNAAFVPRAVTVQSNGTVWQVIGEAYN
jgi:hypothetical protein